MFPTMQRCFRDRFLDDEKAVIGHSLGRVAAHKGAALAAAAGIAAPLRFSWLTGSGTASIRVRFLAEKLRNVAHQPIRNFSALQKRTLE
jgi:hypothetical protein